MKFSIILTLEIVCLVTCKLDINLSIAWFCKFGINFSTVKRVSRKFGFKEVSDDEDWTLYWTDYSVALERVMEMKKYQVHDLWPKYSVFVTYCKFIVSW